MSQHTEADQIKDGVYVRKVYGFASQAVFVRDGRYAQMLSDIPFPSGPLAGTPLPEDATDWVRVGDIPLELGLSDVEGELFVRTGNAGWEVD